MVQLEEVEDEEFDRVQANEKDFDDDDFTDTDSSISDDEDNLPSSGSETLTDRLLALRDMVPPATRRRLTSTVETVTGYITSGLWLGGKAVWVLSTSAFLIGVPLALAVMEEQQINEMEKEQRMRELGNEMLAPGASAPAVEGGQARPAL